MSAERRARDLLREMRGAVVSVDDRVVAKARRQAVVSRMRAVQLGAFDGRAKLRVRRRLWTVGFFLVPSGALAAWLAVSTAERAPHEALAMRTPSGSGTSDQPVPAAPFAVGSPTPSRSAAAPTAPGRDVAPTLSWMAPVAPRPGTSEQDASAPTRAQHRAITQGPRHVSRTASATASSAIISAPFPKGSTLPIENALMESAMSAARDGNDARAVVLFVELLHRYPESPLAAGARTERERAAARLRSGEKRP